VSNDDLAQALTALTQLADSIGAEFDLGHWGGVTEADGWYVRFEGEIRGGEVFVTARSPEEALRLARSEALAQLPDDPG
jgi:hypothetical protein